VEDEVVEVVALREGGKVLARLGGVVIVEFDCDGALMWVVRREIRACE
jgi:hypothetical protein